MNRLSDLSLLLIFGFIDIDRYREKARLERVCKRWRKLLLRDGWKDVKRIHLWEDKAQWIGPIGDRCGANLVECNFCAVRIDSTLIRLIAQHAPALRHLNFACSKLVELDDDENAQQTLRELAARVRSLTFLEQDFRHQRNNQFLRNFHHLRHLCLYLSHRHIDDSLPSCLFAKLRSLRLICLPPHSSLPDLDLLMEKVQNESPRLAAFYLLNEDILVGQPQQLLSQIGKMKNLRFLRIGFNYLVDPELLCSCLNNLSQLVAINMKLSNQQLPDLVGCLAFRGLVHLSLAIIPDQSADNLESIGLLSNFAPQLRSLNLSFHYTQSIWMRQIMGYQVLKMAQNSILQYLNVRDASFTVAQLTHLIRHCPHLQSIVSRLWQNEPLPQVAELRHVVADQWRAGTRKYLPLRFWIFDYPDLSFWERVFDPRKTWQDPFLTIHFKGEYAGPPNPVLDTLLRDEVFNDVDGGGTPTHVTRFYSL